MKNLINYYYNIVVEDFRRIDNYFIFEINNYTYEFSPFIGDLDTIYKIYQYLNSNYIYCDEIIINRNNSFITNYNGMDYILIKKNINANGAVGINEILNYDIKIYERPKFSWKELWIKKVDYYEYQISQIGVKYPIIRESFSYYIGLSECAISLLNYIDEKNLTYNVCHKRIELNETISDFLNPINLTIDNVTRDIAEYFKINFIKEKISEEEIIVNLEKIKFNNNEVILLLARLLFPSYYFDMYDDIIQGKSSEEEIKYFIKKNDCYELFLKKIYNYFRFKYNIIEIEWLKN